MANLRQKIEASLPYLLLPLYNLSLAGHVTLQQSVIVGGVNATVLAVYQQVVATVVLGFLALFFERGKRPPLSLNFLSWAFFIGFLQIPVGQVLITVSLRYVTVTFETVATTMIPTVIFVLTIFTGQEIFKFWSLVGQAKLLSIISSTAGAVVLVFLSNPDASHAGLQTKDGWLFGCLLVGTSVLMFSLSTLFVERVALKYEADLTLSAAMTAFGTLQTLIVALLMERDRSLWKITWFSLQLLTISYGGIIVAGFGYVSVNWCVRMKGPVFAYAFSPLLIVFSFLIQTFLFGVRASIWSIASALLVICSLYLLLWAKSKDQAKIDPRSSSESSNMEPLLVNTT